MFDLKMRKIANDIHADKMGSDSLQTLRLMGWLTENLCDVVPCDQLERLQAVIAESYERGIACRAALAA